jgi:hypothetical protein
VPPLLPPDFTIRPVPDWWKVVSPFFVRCTPRVLVVTDSLSFGSADFGLSRFLAELAKAVPAPAITTKTHGGWKFDDGTVTTANYDQIWLFGATGLALTDAEVRAIANFMDAGGGLFATGDHATLGRALCGDLPRVRKMRDWQNVPMEIERIDTVTNPGPDHLTQFDDQSDDLPQRIFPHYYGAGGSWSVHALLRSPLGDIDVLPDHPHESVCFVGANLAQRYTLHGLDLDEFPVVGGAPLAPEVVAWSVSAGRYLNPPGTIVGKPPTTPRIFGAVSAWDGHRVQRGRVVCDATWHHFININLDGTGAVAAAGNARNGLRSGSPLTFTPDFHQVAQYYRNILDWLTPPTRRWCRWWIDLVLERYRFPLFEEFRPLPDPHPCPWDPRVALGADVEAALERALGAGAVADIVTAALETADLAELAAYVRPLATGDPSADKRTRALVDGIELRRGILGSVADALLRDLPPSPDSLADHLPDDHDDAALDRRVAVATREAWAAARDHYKQLIKSTTRLLG